MLNTNKMKLAGRLVEINRTRNNELNQLNLKKTNAPCSFHMRILYLFFSFLSFYGGHVRNMILKTSHWHRGTHLDRNWSIILSK